EAAEERVEDLRHEVPGGAGVEEEAVVLKGRGAPAAPVVALEDGDVVAVLRGQRGGGEARDPGADDDDLAHACLALVCVALLSLARSSPGQLVRGRPAAARAARPALTGSGTRMRVRATRCAGVRAMRCVSSANTPKAVHTAGRTERGSRSIAGAARASSAKTSSVRRSRSASVNP